MSSDTCPACGVFSAGESRRDPVLEDRSVSRIVPVMIRPVTFTAALFGGLSSAPAEEPTKGARLELIAEVAAIAPGEPFEAGLRIRHESGYHSYWRSPGEVGFPTSIEWSLPEGFEAGPLRWPVPERVDMAGHPAHGYHGEVILRARVTPPETLDEEEITLTADVAWMACAEACHPGDDTFSLTLPVAAAERPHPEHAQRFEVARAARPGPLEGWTAEVLSSMDAPVIKLRLTPEGETGPALAEPYFFSRDGQVSSIPPEVERLDDGALLLTFERAEYGPEGARTLPGILAFGPEDARCHAVIEPAVPGD